MVNTQLGAVVRQLRRLRSREEGLVGTAPKLLDPDPRHGDLRVGLDFRRVYAAVLEDWLGLPAEAALGAEFEKLPLFRA
jgi:hypothetical protein